MARDFSDTEAQAATITLAALTDGNGRKSAYIDNSGRRDEEVSVTAIIRSGGTNPTAGTLYELWLYTGDGAASGGGDTVHTDDLSTGDVALSATPVSATLIGSVAVTANSNTPFSIEARGVDIMGCDEYAFAIMNETGQTTDSDEADSFLNFVASKASA